MIPIADGEPAGELAVSSPSGRGRLRRRSRSAPTSPAASRANVRRRAHDPEPRQPGRRGLQAPIERHRPSADRGPIARGSVAGSWGASGRSRAGITADGQGRGVTVRGSRDRRGQPRPSSTAGRSRAIAAGATAIADEAEQGDTHIGSPAPPAQGQAPQRRRSGRSPRRPRGSAASSSRPPARPATPSTPRSS